jgi:hypothetical protein
MHQSYYVKRLIVQDAASIPQSSCRYIFDNMIVYGCPAVRGVGGDEVVKANRGYICGHWTTAQSSFINIVCIVLLSLAYFLVCLLTTSYINKRFFLKIVFVIIVHVYVHTFRHFLTNSLN